MNGCRFCLCRMTLWVVASLLPVGHVLAIEETVVTATRVERNSLSIPFAISTVSGDDVQRRQLLGLDESMARVPGVYITNRYNYSRDLRISIRGFGARSNFGVRGIKVFVDGIPSTAPDGQTALDGLDLANVSRIEVIRGPAAALYGASAGGVINIFTEDGPAIPFAEVGVARGSYDFGRYQFKAGGENGRFNYFINGSYLDYDGFRRNSDIEHGTLNGKFRYTFSDGSVGQLIVRAADAPTELDAGGLDAAMVAADRGGTRAQNIQFDAGEEVDDQRVAWSWDKVFGVHSFSLRNYYNWRDFYARLPFAAGGTTTFERFFYGGGGQYSNASALGSFANRVTLGVDVDHMTDDRRRFDNLNGQQGSLGFEQDEEADTVGVYVQEEFALHEQVDLQAGLRYDHVKLAIDDRFLANGDQSAALEFNEINWMVGAVWGPMEALNVYANYATAFETPTFTELANPAQAGTLGGFANVAAQRTRGYELGLKGIVLKRLRYDIAYYDMRVEDEVTTVANVNGRAFFNNADTDRNGVELGLVADLVPGLAATLAYTYTDLEFVRFPSTVAAEGNTLPGVPRHYTYVELDYRHPAGLFVKWDWAFAGGVYADNLNLTRVDSYDVSTVVAGYDYRIGRFTLSPSFGVNNLFNDKYNTDIRIEDTFSRYFEPAPGRNIFGIFRVRYDFDV